MAALLRSVAAVWLRCTAGLTARAQRRVSVAPVRYARGTAERGARGTAPRAPGHTARGLPGAPGDTAGGTTPLESAAPEHWQRLVARRAPALLGPRQPKAAGQPRSFAPSELPGVEMAGQPSEPVFTAEPPAGPPAPPEFRVAPPVSPAPPEFPVVPPAPPAPPRFRVAPPATPVPVEFPVPVRHRVPTRPVYRDLPEGRRRGPRWPDLIDGYEPPPARFPDLPGPALAATEERWTERNTPRWPSLPDDSPLWILPPEAVLEEHLRQLDDEQRGM